MTTKPVHYHEGGFPPKDIDWESLIPLVGPANAALARYDGTLLAIPNASLLLSPLMTQEAVLSSRIEGTQTTMGEVLEYEAGITLQIDPRKKADINEVLNYRKAMWRAVELLKDLPLCLRLLNETHKVLLKGVRGDNKSPGEFRKIQNWIGRPGSPIEKATYIPISSEKLPGAMSKWERFIHQGYQDKLVQLSILHGEFEALHPYLDGNGRIGRMFVPLFLFSNKLIQSPMFYISAFLEAHKDEYYDNLRNISRKNDWTGWCRYFLVAIKEQAIENHEKATAILRLYETEKNRIIQFLNSPYAFKALDFIFVRPIFSSTAFIGESGIPSRATAQRILKSMRDNDMFGVVTPAEGRKPTVFVFRALMNIVEGREVF
jgi:Fic family protein